jgi:hypothetical protein
MDTANRCRGGKNKTERIFSSNPTTQTEMSSSVVKSAKMKTLTFIPTPTSFVLDFDEWYSMKKDDFKTEADAVRQWEAMCDHADDEIEIDDGGYIDWATVEEKVDEIQEEYKTDYYDFDMMAFIDEVEEKFQAIGIEFHRNYSCCGTCAHTELADAKNYVFYHGQANEGLRKGERELYLGFKFDAETKAKVIDIAFQMKYANPKKIIYWSGDDETAIYLTLDNELLEAHIKEVADREVRLAKMDAERKADAEKKDAEKKARREELLKQLAELDK